MIRTIVASCLAVLFFTQHGSAQPSFDPAAQEKGAVARWAHKYGSRSLTYLGPDGAHFRYEWRNKIRGPDNVMMIWRDITAQKTRLEAGDVVQTYEPHDCRLTVGRCEYTYTYVHKTLPENRQEKWVVINSLDGDVWAYKKYVHIESAANLRSEGTFTVDGYGMQIDVKSKTYGKGSSKARLGWMKRIPSAKR